MYWALVCISTLTGQLLYAGDATTQTECELEAQQIEWEHPGEASCSCSQ